MHPSPSLDFRVLVPSPRIHVFSTIRILVWRYRPAFVNCVGVAVPFQFLSMWASSRVTLAKARTQRTSTSGATAIRYQHSSSAPPATKFCQTTRLKVYTSLRLLDPPSLPSEAEARGTPLCGLAIACLYCINDTRTFVEMLNTFAQLNGFAQSNERKAAILDDGSLSCDTCSEYLCTCP